MSAQDIARAASLRLELTAEECAEYMASGFSKRWESLCLAVHALDGWMGVAREHGQTRYELSHVIEHAAWRMRDEFRVALPPCLHGSAS